MIPIRIAGFTRVLGRSQGYLGLAVRDEVNTIDGVSAPLMTSAWELTPAELDRIKEGAHIQLSVLGTSHPPVILTVGPVPEEGQNMHMLLIPANELAVGETTPELILAARHSFQTMPSLPRIYVVPDPTGGNVYRGATMADSSIIQAVRDIDGTIKLPVFYR